ncbi:hypothetical protein [Mycolicibacterium komossense]|uniref:TetR family transcriptional regulator n=1 Tax=Mycolicibacterium komossense TaxID=1779 RepID=A0ABT3CLJ5_9MYCO|nr:hypothetical protein [Mycolicibacterium komossense]MCV7230414.1 hypothetical protein [Mycolicibacterium komossense]
MSADGGQALEVGGDDFDPSNVAAVTPAVQAMREIIAAEVVHKDSLQAHALTAEYAEVHGRYLVYAGATFIDCHATDEATPDLAEDRFHYLLTRIGNMVNLLADRAGADEATVLLDVLSFLDRASKHVGEPGATALRAAQTCLVSHSLVRRGRTPWGIQRSLNRTDMLVANRALGNVLVIVACTSDPECWVDVVAVLLQEAGHILRGQARAAAVSIEHLVEQYFLALAAREACGT